VLIGLVGTFYTVAGGIRAVVWIDVIQFALVVGAALLTLGILLHKIPVPVGEIVDVLQQPVPALDDHSKLRLVDTSLDFTKPFTLWAALFGVVFLNTAAYGVDHDLAQRFLVARSPLRGSLSVVASQFISIAVVSLFVGIGLLLYVFYKRPDVMGAAAPDYAPLGGTQPVYPQFLLKELPPALSGLAIAGFFAIAQGSMDSAINAMAASAVADVYLPLRRRMGRPIDPRQSTEAPKVAVAVMGVVMSLFAVGCALAYDPQQRTLLNYVLGIMTFAFAGMLGVFLTALLTRRGNNYSVLAALAAGVLTIVLLQDGVLGWWTEELFGSRKKLAWPWWMPIGTTVSFLVCLAGRPLPRPRPDPLLGGRRGFPMDAGSQRD
jgi:Na+/proline symporter